MSVLIAFILVVFCSFYILLASNEGLRFKPKYRAKMSSKYLRFDDQFAAAMSSLLTLESNQGNYI